ncbi:MAG: GTPase ObgE [Candidatus Levybacteria bacterium]|nr:GTPase ObgE [Candidatus Levybacteria bacterium]
MALIDDVIIRVKAGDGGKGGQSFSSGVAPDGGNGGEGGDVFVVGSTNVADLSQFRFTKDIRALDGTNGQNKKLHGKKGESVTILVPLGTTVTDTKSGEFVEILEKDKPFVVAYGGRGKIGNYAEIAERRKRNVVTDEMQKGDSRELHLVLNLIADIGFIGLPNAGKSSLLKALTNATPKIGNYPFTTLEPNLGILELDTDTKTAIAIADIPGLIKGASTGKGLGITFLKHIQKTKILFHCIDATSENLLDVYKTVRDEFGAYDPNLLLKDEIILLTKIDLLENGQLDQKISELSATGKKVIPLSIYDKQNMEDLKTLISTTTNS